MRELRGELDAGPHVQGDGLALEGQARRLETAGAGDFEEFASLARGGFVQVEGEDELVAVDVATADDLAEVVDDLLGHGFGVLMLRLEKTAVTRRRKWEARSGRIGKRRSGRR